MSAIDRISKDKRLAPYRALLEDEGDWIENASTEEILAYVKASDFYPIEIVVSLHPDFMGSCEDLDEYRRAVIEVFSEHEEYEVSFDANYQLASWYCENHFDDDADPGFVEYLLQQAWSAIGEQ